MSGGCQQRQKLATAVEGHQVIAPAHVGSANVNLWHGAPAGGVHHELALHRVQVDANFFNQLNRALILYYLIFYNKFRISFLYSPCLSLKYANAESVH